MSLEAKAEARDAAASPCQPASRNLEAPRLAAIAPEFERQVHHTPMTPQRSIRNFSIIAHIDHGKSTLADRILEVTGALTEREMRAQFLDKMDIERERGITIKAQTVRLNFTAADGQVYELNLIDTPGHVDFNYEVSRSLAACEGAVLVVDSTQGVEAQTLANVYLAIEQGLEILPVLNKIDLPSSDVEGTKTQIEQVVGLDCAEALAASGKTGAGVREILEQIVKKVPPPKGREDAFLRALTFDSWYDTYRGAVAMIRVVDGFVKKATSSAVRPTGTDYEVTEMGVFKPFAAAVDELGPGEVGFIAANIKSVHDVAVAMTRTPYAIRAAETCGAPCSMGPSTDPLPGFKDVKPMVFARCLPDRQHPVPRRSRDAPATSPHERRGVLDSKRGRQKKLGMVKIPLWISSACSTWKDHPGAPRARVQPRPHHHGAEYRLQHR